MLFIEPACQPYADKINQVLAHHLPYEFHGYPTNFTAPNPHDNGVQLLQHITERAGEPHTSRCTQFMSSLLTTWALNLSSRSNPPIGSAFRNFATFYAQ